MLFSEVYYFIQALLYHRFIRFPAGSHELCTLVSNPIEFLLQPINLLLKSLYGCIVFLLFNNQSAPPLLIIHLLMIKSNRFFIYLHKFLLLFDD